LCKSVKVYINCLQVYVWLIFYSWVIYIIVGYWIKLVICCICEIVISQLWVLNKMYLMIINYRYDEAYLLRINHSVVMFIDDPSTAKIFKEGRFFLISLRYCCTWSACKVNYRFPATDLSFTVASITANILMEFFEVSRCI
jgi:hypothetical protein